MFRFAAAFALLGFAAAIGVALFGDAPITTVIMSALLWAASFGVLGFFVGRTAMALLSEAGIPESGIPESEAEELESSALESGDSETGDVPAGPQSTVLEDSEDGINNRSGDAAIKPIVDDETPQSSTGGGSERAATEA